MLQIKVGADVREAIEGLKKFGTEIGKAGGVTEAAANKMNSALSGIKPLAIHIDTSKLGSGVALIDQMKAKVEEFRAALKLATDPRDTEVLTKGINTINSQIKQIEKAGNPLKGFHVGVLQSERTLAGFDGVLRNVTSGTGNFETTITSLLENFLRLRTETGGTGSALKELGGSLMGAGGLSLAISLASSLLVTFGDELFSSGDSAKKVQDQIDALTSSIQFLNSEASRIGGLFSFDTNIEVAKLKAQGADAQKVFEAQLAELTKRRGLLLSTGTEISSKNTSIVMDPKFSLKEYELLKQTGEKLTGLFAKYDVIYQEALKNEKDYYDNEEKIQILTYQNQQRIREDGLKKQKEFEAKSQEQRQKQLEALRDYLEKRKEIILQFQKDFAALGQQSLPLFKDDPKNKELAERLQKELDKLIDKTLIEINVKIKLDEQSKKDFNTELEKLKAPTTPPITNQTDQSIKIDADDFEKKGRELGKRLGGGFDDVFGEIFQDAFDKAFASGLSGNQLENFKAAFVATSLIATQGIQGVSNAFSDFTDALLQGQNGMQAFGNALKSAFKAIAKEIITDIVLAGILSALSGGASNGRLSFAKAFGKVLGLNKGGIVPGSGNGDTVPAMLTPGELVIPKNEVAKVTRLLKESVSLKLPPSLFGTLNVGESLNQLKKFQAFNFNIPKISFPTRRNTDVDSPLKSLQSTLAGSASKKIDVNITGKLLGNDIVLQVARVTQSQKRNFGR